jgi:hypothetical protein
MIQVPVSLARPEEGRGEGPIGLLGAGLPTPTRTGPKVSTLLILQSKADAPLAGIAGARCVTRPLRMHS